jgi:uncharacterized protein
MDVRLGNWMQTFTGRVFYPLDPREDEIFIEDVAHALSMQTRYSGHCLQFYSVAEHCVLAAMCAPMQLKLVTLMHDASEAYLCDVPRPIKSHLDNYKDIEQRLELVIAKKFGFSYPYPHEVKRIDDAMLRVEMDQNMAKPPKDWGLSEDRLPVKLQFWSPSEAEYEFLTAFKAYGGK